MPVAKNKGFLLKINRVKDTNAIAVIFTENGINSFYIKGLFTAKSKRLKDFECMNFLQFNSYQRELGENQGKSLGTIGEVSVVSNIGMLKNSKTQFAEAFIIAELIYKFLAEGESYPEIFEILTDLVALYSASGQELSPAKLQQFLIYFELSLLHHLGFLPSISQNSNSGEKLDLTIPIHLNPDNPGYTNNSSSGAVVDPLIVKVQSYFMASTTNLANVLAVNLTDLQIKSLLKIQANWLSETLERPILALSLLKN